MSIRVSSNHMVYGYQKQLNDANTRQSALLEQGDGSKLHRPSDDIDVVVVGSGIALAEAVAKKLGRGAHLSVFKTYGTAQVPLSDAEIAQKVSRLFDLRPAAIIRDLNLKQPMYEETAKYGHVGRTNEVVTKTFFDSDGNTYTREVELFTWEKLNRLNEVKAAFGL